MKIRVHLVNGHTIDFDAPEAFNLASFAISVRETGRWLDPNVYVPHEAIVAILRVDAEGQPATPKFEGVLQ